MNPKFLSVVLVVVTLIAGIVLGAVGNGALHNKRMKEMSELRSKTGFREYLIKTIQPRDDAQRANVEQIIDAYGEKYRAVRDSQQVAMRAVSDSMRAELATILYDDQIAALDDMFERSRRQADNERKQSKKDKD